MNQSGPQRAEESTSFETNIERLGAIVASLERGDLSLEDSLRLFEEGILLSRASQQRLDTAERRIETLLSVNAQGDIRTAPFDVKP